MVWPGPAQAPVGGPRTLSGTGYSLGLTSRPLPAPNNGISSGEAYKSSPPTPSLLPKVSQPRSGARGLFTPPPHHLPPSLGTASPWEIFPILPSSGRGVCGCTVTPNVLILCLLTSWISGRRTLDLQSSGLSGQEAGGWPPVSLGGGSSPAPSHSGPRERAPLPQQRWAGGLGSGFPTRLPSRLPRLGQHPRRVGGDDRL